MDNEREFKWNVKSLTPGIPEHQAPVVQKMDSVTHRINHYPVDKY